MRSKLNSVVDETKVPQRRSMTLVIDLDQRFQSVAQVDRWSNHGWRSSSKDGCSSGLKRERRWPKKKRTSEDGPTETSMYKSAEVRDFHKSHVIMTVIDTPLTCATEAPPRRKNDDTLDEGAVWFLATFLADWFFVWFIATWVNLVWVKLRDYAVSRVNLFLIILMFLLRVVVIW